MPGSRLDRYRIGLVADLLGKREGLANAAGRDEDLWMGHDAKETAQDETGNGVGGIAVDQILEPGSIVLVVGGILSMRVYEDVDIGQDQIRTP
jgi:hypothetical protein